MEKTLLTLIERVLEGKSDIAIVTKAIRSAFVGQGLPCLVRDGSNNIIPDETGESQETEYVYGRQLYIEVMANITKIAEDNDIDITSTEHAEHLKDIAVVVQRACKKIADDLPTAFKSGKWSEKSGDFGGVSMGKNSAERDSAKAIQAHKDGHISLSWLQEVGAAFVEYANEKSE